MRFAIAAAGLLAAGCASLSATPATDPHANAGVSIFVVAHQDDWQLFMNPEAYKRMDEPGEKAVFVHVTAGDAGKGITGEPVPYYLAREEGALRAVRFMANAANQTTGTTNTVHAGMTPVAGHQIQRAVYGNAVVYFLRLPDGNIVNGSVYTPHPFSLERLRTAQAEYSETIDASAKYVGWSDLVNTLAAIVDHERTAGQPLSLHIAETEEELNQRDHPDHRATALGMEEVATRFQCATVHRYVEYFTKTMPENVAGKDYMVDVGTWAATASGLSDNHAPSTWEPEHNAWIGRSYSRVAKPLGACGDKTAS
jgi:hypothetical protein